MNTSRQTILYLAFNNGSDTRVSKEIETLSGHFETIFIGCSFDGQSYLPIKKLRAFKILRGKHRNPLTIISFIFWVILYRLLYRPRSIHIVDEQLFLSIFPAIIGARVVLDIFDSIFLKRNLPYNKAFFAKKLIYGFCRYLIVTDENRKDLLPSFALDKALVVPNVPKRREYCLPNKKASYLPSDPLKIACFGTLTLERGISFLNSITQLCTNIEVHCGGWVYDEKVKSIISNNPSFTFYSYMKQEEVIQFCSTMDCILMIYPNNNVNNVFASPNKIYDAITAQTPVVSVEDIAITKLVLEKEIGVSITREETNSPTLKTIDTLFSLKSFSFPNVEVLRENYCWEKFEDLIINSHRG